MCGVCDMDVWWAILDIDTPHPSCLSVSTRSGGSIAARLNLVTEEGVLSMEGVAPPPIYSGSGHSE